ncbi:hypothetical protein [Paenibacillus wynnii]|uniref:Uncharacterized protein n=1 Tax=Paenibacillus wynnii TaxID=268407 RepID=A0A098M6L3_9BACL|nr:hypothetical protein [Paenibacillus wynnii]KGE17673.1 hypothetical protein PWYN_24180 [Paenibacillus wynnii]
MPVKKLSKILLISFIAIIIRSMLQLLIPSGNQTVLQQSVFVKNGTLPIVFMIYGTLAFTAITIIFERIQRGMGGGRISKGLKAGIIFSVVWTVFLVEPLPHGSTIDLFSYPLADGLVLLFLGFMSGRFLSEDSAQKKHKVTSNSIVNIAIITLIFTMGRIILYKGFHIYSMFEQAQVRTLVWVICTGIVIGLMFEYLNYTINSNKAFTKSLVFGGAIFGINLVFFNFFLPLVLKVDIQDMIIRTVMDTVSVIIGCLIINVKDSKVIHRTNNSRSIS